MENLKVHKTVDLVYSSQKYNYPVSDLFWLPVSLSCPFFSVRNAPALSQILCFASALNGAKTETGLCEMWHPTCCQMAPTEEFSHWSMNIKFAYFNPVKEDNNLLSLWSLNEYLLCSNKLKPRVPRELMLSEVFSGFQRAMLDTAYPLLNLHTNFSKVSLSLERHRRHRWKFIFYYPRGLKFLISDRNSYNFLDLHHSDL